MFTNVLVTLSLVASVVYAAPTTFTRRQTITSSDGTAVTKHPTFSSLAVTSLSTLVWAVSRTVNSSFNVSWTTTLSPFPIASRRLLMSKSSNRSLALVASSKQGKGSPVQLVLLPRLMGRLLKRNVPTRWHSLVLEMSMQV
ncbi:hypothetical protein DL96DRAFT_700844 [Flagelloscypha sp. PMI_526]|nr:hypothetical protein DL96DRAFT_700844 [Flagelloscypha sp. PMI_526]